MSRDLNLYLQDICVCIDKIANYIEDMGYSDFIQDAKTLDAVIHNLLIIGEATKQIPDSLRQQYPEIPWRQIAGLRDVIAHNYFRVNFQIVWDVIQVELDPLHKVIMIMLNDDNQTNEE